MARQIKANSWYRIQGYEYFSAVVPATMIDAIDSPEGVSHLVIFGNTNYRKTTDTSHWHFDAAIVDLDDTDAQFLDVLMERSQIPVVNLSSLVRDEYESTGFMTEADLIQRSNQYISDHLLPIVKRLSQKVSSRYPELDDQCPVPILSYRTSYYSAVADMPAFHDYLWNKTAID